jgi:hypothetical protein
MTAQQSGAWLERQLWLSILPEPSQDIIGGTHRKHEIRFEPTHEKLDQTRILQAYQQQTFLVYLIVHIKVFLWNLTEISVHERSRVSLYSIFIRRRFEIVPRPALGFSDGTYSYVFGKHGSSRDTMCSSLFLPPFSCMSLKVDPGILFRGHDFTTWDLGPTDDFML